MLCQTGVFFLESLCLYDKRIGKPIDKTSVNSEHFIAKNLIKYQVTFAPSMCRCMYVSMSSSRVASLSEKAKDV